MVSIGEYQSAADPGPASWVAAGVQGFAENVLSVVPAGFPAYGRIFHPAYRRGQDEPVRWAEGARAAGRVAHSAMQWPSVIGPLPTEHRQSHPHAWDTEPEQGSMPPEVVTPLVRLLDRHTTTPDRCWFAVWTGFGALSLSVGDAPTFELPNRQYFLFAGPIRAAQTSLEDTPFRQSPNLWWPEDHAWCVATEIDFMSSYVAGSCDCIEELVAQDDLEASAVEHTDGITWAADTINAPAS